MASCEAHLQWLNIGSEIHEIYQTLEIFGKVIPPYPTCRLFTFLPLNSNYSGWLAVNFTQTYLHACNNTIKIYSYNFNLSPSRYPQISSINKKNQALIWKFTKKDLIDVHLSEEASDKIELYNEF